MAGKREICGPFTARIPLGADYLSADDETAFIQPGARLIQWWASDGSSLVAFDIRIEFAQEQGETLLLHVPSTTPFELLYPDCNCKPGCCCGLPRIKIDAKSSAAGTLTLNILVA